MPFTPFHMGPGLLIKALLQSCFSLMVFGWAQIIMDIQPLLVMLTGEGHLHGFSHTYIGASLLTVVAALSGKYLAQWALRRYGLMSPAGRISWPIVVFSAFIGCFSHVAIDSLMHTDLQPFFPLADHNPFVGWLSIELIHRLCLYSGLLGGVLYFGIALWFKRKQGATQSTDK